MAGKLAIMKKGWMMNTLYDVTPIILKGAMLKARPIKDKWGNVARMSAQPTPSVSVWLL